MKKRDAHCAVGGGDLCWESGVSAGSGCGIEPHDCQHRGCSALGPAGNKKLSLEVRKGKRETDQTPRAAF